MTEDPVRRPVVPEATPRPGAADEFDARSLRAETAARFTAAAAAIDAGDLSFPLPGGGATAERFAALRAVAEDDLCLARLVEGHVDALAVLAELGGPAPAPGRRWGVWAAEPPGEGLTAVRDRDGRWSLSGLKQYCSGAHSCTHALVTARAEDGRRLFAVALTRGTYEPVEGTWQALGMAGSDTPDVRFHAAAAEPVGDVEGYVNRPGFQHGGIGVAACWLGGAHAVARSLRAAGRRGSGPHTDAHLGAVDIDLHTAGLVLEDAAAGIDADPMDRKGGARLRGLRARAFVEAVCERILSHVGRATGAGPLCHDRRHARDVADLTVYIRQHHAERDLADIGALVSGRDER
ncbi:acyl-CoA dehydrogenase [Streptomyces sp. SID3915]|uniref:acyl-CoA dehydrogenase n=1 Tax=Streptomyces sp. SID3915 TaxID=2690263 RepID=UPI00136C8953|nr:acyl-CoA dehydrogenase [Streptomyces sp. SID3915]MYX75580.1 acyl-CoA dehydrogenase [Streptomyces sp. SID3915]